MVRRRIRPPILAKVGEELEVVEKRKPIGGVKGRLTVVREVVEEERGKIEEWNKDEMGNVGDPMEEL